MYRRRKQATAAARGKGRRASALLAGGSAQRGENLAPAVGKANPLFRPPTPARGGGDGGKKKAGASRAAVENPLLKARRGGGGGGDEKEAHVPTTGNPSLPASTRGSSRRSSVSGGVSGDPQPASTAPNAGAPTGSGGLPSPLRSGAVSGVMSPLSGGGRSRKASFALAGSTSSPRGGAQRKGGGGQSPAGEGSGAVTPLRARSQRPSNIREAAAAAAGADAPQPGGAAVAAAAAAGEGAPQLGGAAAAAAAAGEGAPQLGSAAAAAGEGAPQLGGAVAGEAAPVPGGGGGGDGVAAPVGAAAATPADAPLSVAAAAPAAAAVAAARLSAGGDARLTTKEWSALKNARTSGRFRAPAGEGAPVEAALASSGWKKAYDAQGVPRFVHESGRAAGNIAELLVELGVVPPEVAAAAAAEAAGGGNLKGAPPLPPPPPPVAAPALPAGWVAQFSTTKQKPFYVHTATGATQWKLENIPGYAPGASVDISGYAPGASAAQPASPVAPANASAHAAGASAAQAALAEDAKLGALPAGWEAKFSNSKGRVYYLFPATGASVWKRNQITPQRAPI